MQLIRLRNLGLALSVLPRLIARREERVLLREMQAMARRLPGILEAPLPQAMAELAPEPGAGGSRDAGTVRRLADVAALLERRSPLGICLRRSLLRYHFLRRAGVPLVVQFGARFAQKQVGREIAGHAWVTLDGEPYYERSDNWQGFAVIYRWPE